MAEVIVAKKGKSDLDRIFKIAAVQGSPVFLNSRNTIEKVRYMVEDSSGKGADIVAFGESFIPAFPVWNLVYAPIDQHDFFKAIYYNSIEIPGEEFNMLAKIAKKHKVYLSIGITERGKTPGTMWNTNLLFNREGKLINKRRKLVP
ncbi:MAG: nitrilase-related carbon-nitrogen hydrolase, partial [Conexivisphaerales archaeon]